MLPKCVMIPVDRSSVTRSIVIDKVGVVIVPISDGCPPPFRCNKKQAQITTAQFTISIHDE